ncbi:MAG: YncE family protein [Planctomycetota bacterium]|nr:YncE family protein [Planctomycetota bacterium]
MIRVAAIAALSAAAAVGAQQAPPTGDAADGKSKTYTVYVACESSDEVYIVDFDGQRAETRDVFEVGYQATEIEGPHGLTIDPTGDHWYCSIAHGKPFGALYKYRVGSNELVGECELGMFPATMQISPMTGLLYVVNFNLHGRMLPSTVSIVDPDEMVEVARTVTGAMPHGSRLTSAGDKHYSCAMMSGELYEIDAATFSVTRNMQLDVDLPKNHASEAKPTWVSPHPTAPRIYAALNGKAQIVEVDTQQWLVTRRFQTGKAPYNLDLTPDGRALVATYKGEQAIGVWDLVAGRERARIASSRPVTHGVVCSRDGRFAFVTCESRNADPGTLDIVDLQTDEVIATVVVGLQAGGVALLER